MYALKDLKLPNENQGTTGFATIALILEDMIMYINNYVAGFIIILQIKHKSMVIHIYLISLWTDPRRSSRSLKAVMLVLVFWNSWE